MEVNDSLKHMFTCIFILPSSVVLETVFLFVCDKLQSLFELLLLLP